MKCPKCGSKFTIKKGKKKQYLDFVFLTDDDHKKLVEKFDIQGTRDRIGNLDEAIDIHGYKYKNHYRVILKWAREEPKEINRPPVKPKRMPRKETKQERELLDKMKALNKNFNWRDPVQVKEKATEMKKLQKQYDDLRSAPQKLGDILRS